MRTRDTERPFNEVLQYFATERFLQRLSRSGNADSFVLKGALLFRVWNVPDSRATRDIDFLAYVDNSPEKLTAIFREACAIDDPDDGLVFDPDTVEAQRIKEDAGYDRNTEMIEFEGLAAELVDNENFDKQWSAFLRKSALTGPGDFPQLLAAIGKFLSPVFSSVKSNEVLDQDWAAPGPWRSAKRSRHQS